MTTTTWLPGMPLTHLNAGQAVMRNGYQLALGALTGTMTANAPQQLAVWRSLQTGTAPTVNLRRSYGS